MKRFGSILEWDQVYSRNISRPNLGTMPWAPAPLYSGIKRANREADHLYLSGFDYDYVEYNLYIPSWPGTQGSR
jgi:hypothetical protein